MEQVPKIPTSDVTPPHVYFNRRRFMRAGAAIGSVSATAALYRALNPVGLSPLKTPALLPELSVEDSTAASANQGNQSSSLHDTAPQTNGTDSQSVAATTAKPLTPEELLERGYMVNEPWTPGRFIVNYNNFYEFTTSKEGVARAAAGFKTEGWQIRIDGLVDKPRSLSIEELHSLSKPQERIYRMRCVEGWSMVIPWVGVPLAHVLEAVQPQAAAKYVAFETLLDPQRMPGQRTPVLPWPYVEGLRLDEAMHPLTILATGLYRQAMPPQDGAPVRLVVPWKYGFKGIKSIVRIGLVAQEPPTTWNQFAPQEYGFYANVNPEVDHPRWSQASEQRIGEIGRRKTLMFNGYETQVAPLYAGMDLRKHF